MSATKMTLSEGQAHVLTRASLIDHGVQKVLSAVLEANYPGLAERERFERKTRIFTAREIEIIVQIGRGNTNKEIGRIFSISSRKVKDHITAIMKKLEVQDRTAVVMKVIKWELFHLDDF